MKRLFFILNWIISALLVSAASADNGSLFHAQNRWKVYGGGSVSHLCEKPWISSDKSYGWGGGAFIGGGYELNFNSHWSLTPQMEIAFENNGATLDSSELSFLANHANWHSMWCVNIPLLTSFRFAISEKCGFRIGIGPYLQEALSGRCYGTEGNKKVSMSGNFSKRFNVGAMGEIAFETGRHFSYMIRSSYPFLKEGWERKTITLSIGIGYTF